MLTPRTAVVAPVMSTLFEKIGTVANYPCGPKFLTRKVVNEHAYSRKEASKCE